jgi:hypothetical protein
MPEFKLKPSSPAKRYIPKVSWSEQHIQTQVCNWLRLNYPNAIWRSDFSSGQNKSPYLAQLHKSLQSSRSFPDLFIYEPRRGYHGLAIELKAEGTTIILSRGENRGKLTSNEHIREQFFMLKALKEKGYYANFGIGYDSTIKLLQWYFGVSAPERQKLF